MAWKFGDSFDHYATAGLGAKYVDYGAVGTGTRINASGGIDGTGCAEFYNGNGRVGRAVSNDNASAICYCGFFYKISGFFSQFAIHSLFDGPQNYGQVTYTINNDGSISVWRVVSNNAFHGFTSSTQLATTGPGVILLNTWHHLQFGTKIHNSTGWAKVYVDGNLVLDESGLDTQNNSAGTAAYSLVGAGGVAAGYLAQLDNLWICDDEDVGDGATDFLGPLIGECVFANGVGNSSDFAPTSGANYLNVDDATPDDDTTIVAGADVGDRDTYAHGALTRVQTGIRCVQQVTIGKKSSGNTRAIAHVIRIGSTDYDGGDLYLPTSYAAQITPRGKNPDTTNDWDASEVDATEMGQVVTV